MEEIVNPAEEEIEGNALPPGHGWGDYPLDSVFVRQETRTVSEVFGRIRKGRYVLNPDFQRDFLWPIDKQSRLIESCLMRIPLPVFYLAEASDGKIIVVDGLQRLETFSRFLQDKFALALRQEENTNESLSTSVLHGKRFSQLSDTLRERVEDTQLILYILDPKAPVRAKLDIFERVNSGVPLTRQQMRNALYNGKATNWLVEAAGLQSFRDATQEKLNSKTMLDREAVNHFCAFKLIGYDRYDGDMDDYLAKALEQMNAMSDEALSGLKSSFDRSMRFNQRCFVRNAFCKSALSPGSYARFNMSLFESFSVIFSEERWNDQTDPGKVRQIAEGLSTNSSFIQAISSSTHQTRSVKTRFKAVIEAFA